MKKTIVILMIFTVIAKFSGYLKNITLAYFYGATEISDIFIIALSIPATVFGIVATGISTAYIPIYSKIDHDYNHSKGLYFTNNLIVLTMLFCTIIIISTLVFTEYVVKIFAIGFEGETLDLAVQFTKVSIFGIYFIALFHILKSYLNYKNVFALPSLVSLPMNLIIIIGILLSFTTNWIYILTFSIVISLFSQAIILLIISWKNDYRFKFVLDISDKYIKEMILLAMPVILGSSIIQINRLVDKSLASWITVGGVSSLNYADMLNQAFIGIFVVSFVTVFFPDISRKAAKGDLAGLKISMNKTIVSVMILILPGTAFSMIFSSEIVHLLFDRGAFDENAISLTSTAFFYYSMGIIGISVNLILTRVFYSLEDSKTPMINSSIAVVLNIALSILLGSLIGLGGIPLATSIASTITALLLLKSLRKKLGPLKLKRISSAVSKIFIATLVSSSLSYVTYYYINYYVGDLFAFIVISLIMITTYGILIYVFKVEHVALIFKAILSKLKLS